MAGHHGRVLECVINISEGRRVEVIAAIGAAAGDALLDVHTDPDHHRSVLTVVGEAAARSVATAAVEALDLRGHDGVHPRIGVVDVVPFVPLAPATMTDALAARDAYAAWSADALSVPCFTYGPERTLPDVRRTAWTSLAPTTGADHPHPSAGATAVGARPLLVAYNVWLAEADLALARRIAADLRGPGVRALGLPVGARVQVSMNLVDPLAVGPAEVVDRIRSRAEVAGTELVGLVPAALLEQTPAARWAELDLAPERTIEARLAGTGP